MTAIITVFCYDLGMQLRFTFCFVSLLAVSGISNAWAQVAPGGPLSPSAGWAAQETGPRGKAAILSQGQFFFSTLSNSAIGGKTESTLRYGVSDKLSVGFLHLQKQATLRPNVNYTITQESLESPALSVGFYDSSIGGKSSVFYATAARTISDMGPVTFSGYLGLAKVSSESAPRLLVGAAMPLLGKRVTASAQWEGKRLTLGVAGSVGTLGKYPIRFGLVAVGDTVGPLTSTTWQK
jgi:hypothetical protein